MIIAESYSACAGLTHRRGRGGFRQRKSLILPCLAIVGQALRLAILHPATEAVALQSSWAGAGIMPQGKIPKHTGKPEYNRRRDD